MVLLSRFAQKNRSKSDSRILDCVNVQLVLIKIIIENFRENFWQWATFDHTRTENFIIISITLARSNSEKEYY